MENTNRLKIIYNIDSKLNILYKNMSKQEYYEFLDKNQEIKAYNDLLNNISLNIVPNSYLSLIPLNILLEINTKVFNEFIFFMDNQKELVLT